MGVETHVSFISVKVKIQEEVEKCSDSIMLNL